MTDNDSLDNDFEQGTEGDFSEEADQPAARPAKKKSGGGLMIVVLLLLLGGGVIFAAPFLGIQLPFSLPGMTSAPPVPPENVTANTSLSPKPQAQNQINNPEPSAPPVENALMENGEAPGNTHNPYDVSPENLASSPGPIVSGELTAIPPAIGSLDSLPAPDFEVPPPVAASGMDPLAAVAPPGMVTEMDAAGNSEDILAGPPALSEAIIAPPHSDAVLDMSGNLPAAASTVTNSVSAPADADTRETIAALEQKIVDLEGALSEIQQSFVSKSDLGEIKASIENLEEGLASRKNAAALKAAKREVENYRNGVMPDVVKDELVFSEPSRPAVGKKKSASAKPPSWVLRSAKPGIAWVAQKGSTELKTVSVGDTLSGIGKVTAIVKDSTGHWVVNGTKGFLAQ